MEPPNIYVDMAEKIIKEREFFKISRKDGKKRLYKREGNLLVEEQNNDLLEQRCLAEILENLKLGHLSEKSSTTKHFKELLFYLKLLPEFTEKEDAFIPSPDSIPLANGDFSFENNGLKKDDGKTLRFTRLNASYEERYVNGPLPDLLIRLLRNGISNPQLTQEENDRRYESLLDCLSYAFYPGNPNRKFFIISGAPHSGKTTLLTVFRNIFGPYANSMEMHSLKRQSRPNPEARPDLHGISEKLWMDVAELDQGKIQTKLIKNLAGNDPIVSRKLYSSEMKEEVIKGKFFIVSNSYPQFDDRNDEALKERLVIFDWHNSVSDNDTIYDMADILNSEENRNRIATFFINRISQCCYSRGRSMNFHPSFVFRPELSCDDAELGLRKFLDECLICRGGVKWPWFDPMPLPELCVPDIHRAYINYLINILKKPVSSAINSKKIRSFLQDYFDTFYPQVEVHRIENGWFCKGVIVNSPAFNFLRRPPVYGNFGKPKILPFSSGY